MLICDKSTFCSGILAIAFFAGLLFAASGEAATIYVWRDDNGVRQYSDYCPPDEKCRVKRVGNRRKARLLDTTSTSPTDTSTADTINTDTSMTSSSGGSTTDTAADTAPYDAATDTTADSGTDDTMDGADTTTSESTTSGDSTASGDTTTSGDVGASGDTTSSGDTTTATNSGDADGTTSSGDAGGTTSTTNNPVANGFADLTWDAVVHPDLGGYNVFYAKAGKAYQLIDVGVTTTYSMTGLESGTRYYFRVAAYDLSGNQGGFSKEVYKDMP